MNRSVARQPFAADRRGTRSAAPSCSSGLERRPTPDQAKRFSAAPLPSGRWSCSPSVSTLSRTIPMWQRTISQLALALSSCTAVSLTVSRRSISAGGTGTNRGVGPCSHFSCGRARARGRPRARDLVAPVHPPSRPEATSDELLTCPSMSHDWRADALRLSARFPPRPALAPRSGVPRSAGAGTDGSLLHP
jgi:hypothetical protein